MPSIPQQIPGYVYLIRMGDSNYFKVGISYASIEQRLSNLQTATPYPLVRIASYKQVNPREVELSIHRALQQCRVRNEWFQCDQNEIEQVFHYYNAMAEIDTALDGGTSQTRPALEFSDQEIEQIAARIARGEKKTDVVIGMPGYASRNHKVYAEYYDKLKTAIENT